MSSMKQRRDEAIRAIEAKLPNLFATTNAKLGDALREELATNAYDALIEAGYTITPERAPAEIDPDEVIEIKGETLLVEGNSSFQMHTAGVVTIDTNPAAEQTRADHAQPVGLPQSSFQPGAGTIGPPWSLETVEGLNRWQQSPSVHPFTCPNRGDGKHSTNYADHDNGVLVATRAGWVCRDCGYNQVWAYAFMTKQPPDHILLPLRTPLEIWGTCCPDDPDCEHSCLSVTELARWMNTPLTQEEVDERW